jgi:hypothetical protein
MDKILTQEQKVLEQIYVLLLGVVTISNVYSERLYREMETLRKLIDELEK